MGARTCKAGHGFASYLEACPFCEGKSAEKSVTPSRQRDTVTVTPDSASPVTPLQDVTVSRQNVTLQHCPTCTCGERKVYTDNAARQRAYRGRRG